MTLLERRVDFVVDAGFGVAFAAVQVTAAVAIGASWGGFWVLDAIAGSVGCVIALSRRRHPGWAAVAGLTVAGIAILVARAADLPQAPGPGLVLALAVLVGSAVRALPARTAVAVAAAGSAVVAGTWLAASPSSSGLTAVTTFNAAGWLGALAIGLSGRLVDARRRAVAEQVRREERLELARELHDVAAHHLTGLVLQTQGAQLAARRRPDGPASSLSDVLADVETAGSDALVAIRRVVGLLRDTADAPPARPGFEQLSELIGRFEGVHGGPAVHLQVPEGEPVWPAEVTSTVYRVIQESLTNVAQHAPDARSVAITIGQDAQALTVEVTDDAPVPAVRYHRRGYGLIGMRERVEALGGTLHAGRRGDAGWSITATLPVPGADPR